MSMELLWIALLLICLLAAVVASGKKEVHEPKPTKPIPGLALSDKNLPDVGQTISLPADTTLNYHCWKTGGDFIRISEDERWL